MGPERCARIEGVISDLGPAYVGVIAQAVPHAVHLLDRFHVIQWVNEAVNTIRREVFGALPR
ncbi:MAG: transposase [Candidatus Eisenbacteria bacterium]|nr:transposase [Candidatus Eisenbacteria bacterium]